MIDVVKGFSNDHAGIRSRCIKGSSDPPGIGIMKIESNRDFPKIDMTGASITNVEEGEESYG